jgi:hypothetical protein
MWRTSVSTLIAILIVMFWSATAAGALLAVPSSYSSIGLAAAASSNGDTILVSCGTYREHDIVLPTGVSVVGNELTPDCVVIDTQALGRAFSGQSMHLKGLTILNGRAFSSGAGVAGSGLIQNCVFTDNHATLYPGTVDGGAVFGAFSIHSSVFTRNSAVGYGGAVANATEVVGCYFAGNYSEREWGGAIHNTSSIRDSRFEGNYAHDGGSAIYCAFSSTSVENCTFTANGVAGTGVLRTHNAGTVVRNCLFYDNGPSSIAMNFTSESGPFYPLVENCTVVGEGYAISSSPNRTGDILLTVRNSIIAYNQWAFAGSAATSCTAVCCLFWSNSNLNHMGPTSSIQEDPRFCDVLTRDLTLRSDSPCLPENNLGCGQVGANTAGCPGSTSPDSQTLFVDFGDGGLQPGHWPYTSTMGGAVEFATNLATDGTATVSLEPQSRVESRVRGGITWGPHTSLSNLLRDFVFVWSDTLITLRVSGLSSGNYTIKTFHHDSEFDNHGSLRITAIDALGARIVREHLAQSAGQTPSTVAMGEFGVQCAAAGDIVLRFEVEAGTGNAAILNGLQIVRGSPMLLTVTDVPNDQGGKLALTWNRHGADMSDSFLPITSYVAQKMSGDWESIAFLNATQAASYAIEVDTPEVFTPPSPPIYSRYRIMALTDDPGVRHFSLPDSGYSIDNLPPAAPVLALVDGETFRTLHWVNDDASDFSETCLYRSFQMETPDSTSVFCSPAQNWYLETDRNRYYYRARSKDVHGNEGAWSEAVIGRWPTPVPGAAPRELRLYTCQPNPFNPRAALTFDLPSDGDTRLVVFDLSGRLVRVLVDESRTAGRHQLVWDGTDGQGRAVASGTYIARLQFNGAFRITEMTVIR